MHRTILSVVACLSGCSTQPPASACFTDVFPRSGWKLHEGAPPDAEQLRRIAEPHFAMPRDEHAHEYWFFSGNDRVLLCRPVRADGCFSELGILRRQEDGVWGWDPESPLGITCIA